MTEKQYRICMSVPLGRRVGVMTVRESGGEVSGWFELMNHRNDFIGLLTDDGCLTLSGVLHTLISTIKYTAVGEIRGRELTLSLKTAAGAYYPISGEELCRDDEII